MQLRVVEFASAGYWTTTDKRQSVFRVFDRNGRNLNSNGCYVQNGVNNTWRTEIYLFSVDVSLTDTLIPLRLVTHNERKDDSPPCSAEAVSDITTEVPDAYEIANDHSIDIKGKQPGVWHDAPEFKNGQTSTWSSIKIQYKYNIPEPEPITFHDINKTCGDDTVHFSTDVKNILGGADKLKYVWEYWLGDYRDELNPQYMACINACNNKPVSCYSNCEPLNTRIQVENWSRIYDVNTRGDIVTRDAHFVPAYFFDGYEDGTGALNEIKTIQFRVTAKADELEKGVASKIFAYNVQPARPKLDPSKITTTTTCAENGTAIVNVKDVQSNTFRYRYILIKGDNPDYCTPEDQAKIPKSCFGREMIESGLVTDGDFSIDTVGFSPNGYTLRVTNPGDNQGVCFNSYFIPTVPRYDSVKVQVGKQDISCESFGDGEIVFASTGGTGTTSFSILKEDVTIGGNLSAGKRDKLAPGIYTIKTDNYCASLQNFLTITEPSRAAAEITTNNTTCINPGNGQLAVTSSRGSESYNYYLYKMNSNSDSTLVTNVSNQGKNWQLSNLAASSYHVIVKDAQREYCPGAINSFSITNPPNLSITDVQKTEVKCAGASTGGIAIQSTGGIGRFIYQITRSSEASPIENTTGAFENLYSGTYSALLKSGVEGCLDSYTYSSPIIISQPDPIEISSVKTDIKCYEDANGSITASVKGGQGSFSFTWEKKVNNEWNTYPGNGLEQKSLLPGEYRLKVTDLALCNNVSNPIEVLEPELLKISEVEQIRPDCKGETVKFSPKVDGGTLPYQFLYSTNNGGSYEPFDPTTVLFLGNYKIKATDKNNCAADWNETIEVALNNLVVEKKVTPVCYKSTNGSIELKPKGGNPPYSYSNDNGLNFQPSPTFANLQAGIYPVNVKDNFGCSSTFTLEVVQKQDKPEINFLVASRDNALDTLVIAEVSRPKPDSLFWNFDPAAIVIDTNKAMPEIRFNGEGKYKIAMTGYFGGCVYTLQKEVDVKPFVPGKGETPLPGIRPIDQVVVTPNPNDGFFNLKVKLIKKQQLVAIIVDVLGNEQYKKFWDYTDEVDEKIEIPEIATGSYLIRLITDNDARELKIIVRK